MGAVERLDFDKSSATARRLKRSPDQVARMTRPQRELRVRELLGLSHWIVDRAGEKFFSQHRVAAKVILFSGGNDSTVLAHIFREEADLAAHANTGIGIEQTRQFVRDTCADWGLSLLEKSPKEHDSYRSYVLQHGFPGPGQHYRMFQRLKERCLEQVRSDLVSKPRQERVLFLGGRRRSESARRSSVTTWDRRGSMCYASPLTLWTKLDLNTYRLMAGGVPVNEVSDLIHMSGECLCGAFAEKNELDMIGEWFPGVVSQVEALEGLIKGREDIPEARRTWGWGAYRRDLQAMKQQGRFQSGAMCGSCDDRATGGTVLSVTCPTKPEVIDMADEFEDPTPPAGPKLNVSGQPDARYEWRGKQNYGYLVKDPRTGDFLRYKNGKPKGWTRATTFNKSASDSMALNDWGKRNVLIGASLRPDLVSKAHGLTHETGKGELMSLVAELETAAGAKVSAQQGTDIHELTERWDGGQLAFKDIPPMYTGTIGLYVDALKEAGLRPVPGLIERTVFVDDFGGIVGTFDRVYLHEASGQYVIGDVKTGKTLEYGMDEIETQEWIYAAGINRYGVYDWNTDEWVDMIRVDGGRDETITVSEEWGVVVHLPVQGPDAGTCKLVRADLQRGKRHAQVCHDVRVDRANKPKPEPWDASLLGGGYRVDWDSEFSTVQDNDDASAAWLAAKAAGITGPELNRLVQLAQQRLRELGV